MARTFASLDELRAHRAEREKLFEQAVLMHDTGELTDEEFAMVERKHLKRMKRLAKAEAELIAISAMPEVAAELNEPAETESAQEPPLEAIPVEPAALEEPVTPIAEPVALDVPDDSIEPVTAAALFEETEPAPPVTAAALFEPENPAEVEETALPFEPVSLAETLEPEVPVAEPVAPAPAGLWGEVEPTPVAVEPTPFENPLTAAPMVSSDTVPLPGEELPPVAPAEPSPWDSIRPAAVTAEPEPTDDLPPIGLPEPTPAPVAEAAPPASPFAGMFSTPSKDEPQPHDLQPSARDLEILSTGRSVPEEVGLPRPDEVQDLGDDDFDLDEYEQLKELYGREIFVKEQLQKRLKSETEAKQELSQQILDLTRAKDYAHMAASKAKQSAKSNKRMAGMLFVVSFCLLALLAITYYRDLKKSDELRAKANGVSTQLNETKDKLTKLTGEVANLRDAEKKSERDLVDLRQKLSEAQRQQTRLEDKLRIAKTSKAKDVREFDTVVLKYALSQKEQPKVDDEDLLDQLATQLSRDKEEIRGLLSEYTSDPKGHLAKGLSAVFQEQGAKALGTMDQAIDQEKVIMRDMLVLAAHLAAEGNERNVPIRYLDTALGLYPNDVQIRLLLAEAQVKAGAMTEAIMHYRFIVSKLPDRADVALRLGHLLERNNLTAEASAVYQKALEKNVGNRQLLTALAGIEVAQARFSIAVDLLEKALKTEGEANGLGNIHFNLAFAYYGLGQSTKAMEHCTMAKDLGANVAQLEAVLKSQ